MKLAVLSINYFPELTGISVYNTEMCEYLARKGYVIQMFTGFPYYPFGVNFDWWYKEKNARFKLFLNEYAGGVNILRVNLYKPKKTNVKKRIIHELSFCFLTMLRLCFNREKYNLVICISPPLMLGLITYIAAKLKGVPFVIHVQDLQPDAAVELGMLKKGLLTRFLYSLERFVYSKADSICTISEAMREQIINKGFSESKVKLFYNWVDTETLRPMSKDNSFARKHKLVDKFVVLHSGNMGEKQDMRVILEAAERAKLNKSIIFLLVGRGNKRTFVEEYIKKHSLVNVLLLDIQPKIMVNEMFSSIDVGLITQCKNVKNSVMPSKVFGPASVEKPFIIAADDECEISRLAKLFNFGLVIEPENTDKLVAAIFKLNKDRKLAELMGGNGRLFMVNERRMESVIDNFEQGVLKTYSRIYTYVSA